MGNKNNKQRNILFLAGLGLFIIGIIGYAFRIFSWVPVNLSEVLSDNTKFVTQVQLDQKNIRKFTDLFGEGSFMPRLDAYLNQAIEVDFSHDIRPWIGTQFGWAIDDQDQTVWALEHRSKKKAKQFLSKLVTPGEEIITTSVKEGEILTPAFSSNLTFGFYKNWLLISQNPESITKIFAKEKPLRQQETYKSIMTDLPQNYLFSVFINQDAALSYIEDSPQSAKFKPLLQPIGNALPGLGVTFQTNKDSIDVSAKLLSHEGIFEERLITKPKNQTMPELAQYTPKDVLFFINGTDLYAKYKHTKTFLSSLDPQFAIIFDGLLRAQSREVFGQGFDFEQDFLAKMRGQYAFVIDFEEALYPFLNFTFLSGFGGADYDATLSQLHDAIHFAQTQFAPQVEVVDLPNGTTREELVSRRPEEIPIRKIEFENRQYFTAENPLSEKQFTYGFVDNYFTFSTHEEGLKSVISTIEKKQSNLAENIDFRESVLFKFSPSESYGFLNANKLAKGLETMRLASAETTESSSEWIEFLQTKIRNVTFSRKVFPGEVFFKAIIFPR